MRIGQIAVGRKRSLRTQFSPERVLDMPILRAEIPEPWRPRRLRRAARALRKQGVKRVLVPAGFAQWDTLESGGGWGGGRGEVVGGLGPVETGEFCRAMAPAVALAALTGAHIRPEGATVVLRGERVTRAMRMSALKLCPEVKNLLIAAPVGGAGLQAELRREYGVPALEDAPGRAPDLAIHFAPSAGGGARIVDLSGNSPRMDHFSFALREQTLPEDCEGLPLLAALWETGRLDTAQITVFTDFHS